MKFLEIEENKSCYTVDKQNWVIIDQINKDHLLELLDHALSDEFEMDAYEKEKLVTKLTKLFIKIYMKNLAI